MVAGVSLRWAIYTPNKIGWFALLWLATAPTTTTSLLSQMNVCYQSVSRLFLLVDQTVCNTWWGETGGADDFLPSRCILLWELAVVACSPAINAHVWFWWKIITFSPKNHSSLLNFQSFLACLLGLIDSRTAIQSMVISVFLYLFQAQVWRAVSRRKKRIMRVDSLRYCRSNWSICIRIENLKPRAGLNYHSSLVCPTIPDRSVPILQ